MRITKIGLKNYRCLQDVTIYVDDYTALVGPNGTGKSSVLYALDWFFNGGTVAEQDLYVCLDTEVQRELWVEVTFADFNEYERQVLGQYGLGDTTCFRRTWISQDSTHCMQGAKLACKDMVEIQSMTRVGEIRLAYNELRKKYASLPSIDVNSTSKEDILATVASWELSSENKHHLEAIPIETDNNLLRRDGSHLLTPLIKFILVPAGTRISDELSASSKSSPASEVIGTLLEDTAQRLQTSWEEEHAEAIDNLKRQVQMELDESVLGHSDSINSSLRSFIPNASVSFESTEPDWNAKVNLNLITSVTVDGTTTDISRHGHGVQRAVMLALLQADIPSAASESAADDSNTNQFRPLKVVAIEEPEIYQHPVRARHFARTLAKWADRPQSQVILATHSPYFLRPDQVTSLRTFRMSNLATNVNSTDVSAIASIASEADSKIWKAIEKEIPSTFSESFFSDAVVFVEGDTDRIVLETIANLMGVQFDAVGISIVPMGGKQNLKIPYAILKQIGIPTFIIADADHLGAKRKHPDNQKKQFEVAGSHEAATNSLLAWLPTPTRHLHGGPNFEWGDPTVVTDKWCVFYDDLETELASWPSLLRAFDSRGDTLRSKDVAIYRSACAMALVDDMPAPLSSLINTIYSFA